MTFSLISPLKILKKILQKKPSPWKNRLNIWMFPKIGGKTPKWMVKIMENPMNKWMIWCFFPLFLETSIYTKKKIPDEFWSVCKNKFQVGIWWTCRMPSKQTVISCCWQQGLGVFFYVDHGETPPLRVENIPSENGEFPKLLGLENWKFAWLKRMCWNNLWATSLIGVQWIFFNFRKMSKVISCRFKIIV